MHLQKNIQHISHGQEESRVMIEIIEKAKVDYSRILDLYDLNFLAQDEFRLKRAVSIAKEELQEIDIFTKINAVSRGVEDASVQQFIIRFKRIVTPYKIERDRLGYIRERFETKTVTSILSEIRHLSPDFKQRYDRLAVETMREYLIHLIAELKEIEAKIEDTDIGEVLDAEATYGNVQEYRTLVDALFKEIDIMGLLDIEASIYALWDSGVPKDFYILTKAALKELHEREMLDDGEL